MILHACPHHGLLLSDSVFSANSHGKLTDAYERTMPLFAMVVSICMCLERRTIELISKFYLQGSSAGLPALMTHTGTDYDSLPDLMR